MAVRLLLKRFAPAGRPGSREVTHSSAPRSMLAESTTRAPNDCELVSRSARGLSFSERREERDRGTHDVDAVSPDDGRHAHGDADTGNAHGGDADARDADAGDASHGHGPSLQDVAREDGWRHEDGPL